MGPSSQPQVVVPIVSELKPDSVARTGRRTEKKEKDAACKARQAIGKNLHKIKIKPGGDIDVACEGKNAWDEVVRTIIPRILDISVVEWERHDLKSLVKLKVFLDKTFEYVDNELSMVGFKNVVKRSLKT